jgi:hypothetical protein
MTQASPIIDTLLQQEQLIFSLEDGEFHVQKICEFVQQQEDMYQVFEQPIIFQYFWDITSYETTRDRLAEDPNTPLPYNFLMTIWSEEIHMSQVYPKEYQATAKNIITWLLERYDCDIVNEEGTVLK